MARASQFKLSGTLAVKILARLAARNVVKAQLRGQGLRVSHISHAEIMTRANAYLSDHPDSSAI